MEKDLVTLHHRFCQDAMIRNYRSSTVAWYRETMNRFLRHFDGRVRLLDDVSTDILRDYLYERRLRGWKATTFSNQYRALRAFFKWCVKRGYLQANPMDPIEKPRLEKALPRRIEPDHEDRWLTGHDV